MTAASSNFWGNWSILEKVDRYLQTQRILIKECIEVVNICKLLIRQRV